MLSADLECDLLCMLPDTRRLGLAGAVVLAWHVGGSARAELHEHVHCVSTHARAADLGVMW